MMDTRDPSTPTPTHIPASVASVVSSEQTTSASMEDDPMNHEDQLYELYEEVSQSVVTVACVLPERETTYNTGFIIVSEEGYSLIFTLYIGTALTGEYFVIFKGEEVKVRADVLQELEEYLILIVETAKKHSAVTFNDESVGNDLVFTVGTMSGTKLHAITPVIDSLIGKLGFYGGQITTPTCDAFDLRRKPLCGAEQYFQVTVSFQDKIILFSEVDNKTHTSDTLLGAPVFSLTTGKMIGLIHSIGTWGDVKNGLLSNGIIKRIEDMCAIDSQEQKKRKKNVRGVYDWKGRLKNMAGEHLGGSS